MRARRCAAGPPQVASSILARMGYARVTQARDGQEALDHIAARGGPDAFDFILMDLHMPRKARAARGLDSAGHFNNDCTAAAFQGSALCFVLGTRCALFACFYVQSITASFVVCSKVREPLFAQRPGHHHSAERAWQG